MLYRTKAVNHFEEFFVDLPTHWQVAVTQVEDYTQELAAGHLLQFGTLLVDARAHSEYYYDTALTILVTKGIKVYSTKITMVI